MPEPQETRRVSPRWEDPGTVAGFRSGRPNQALLAQARRLLDARGTVRVLDLGCGAARNAVPLAEAGCRVVGVDLSAPMIQAARERAAASSAPGRLSLLLGPMTPLPFVDERFDLIVAHGVWNLARTDAELRAAVAEAGRVARGDAELFVFTFSRGTLPPDARPVPGEALVYEGLGGEPQVFLDEAQLRAELGRGGFRLRGALTEHNRPGPGGLRTHGPVIWEGVFAKAGAP